MELSRQALAGARRFLAPYYTASALLIASYAITREWWLQHGDLKYAHSTPAEMQQKERYALSLMAFAVCVKLWKADSMDAWLSDVLTYGKSAVLLLVWFMDYRLCIYYALLAAVFYLLFPQPIFKGPAAIEQFTPASFKALVEDAPDPEATWLVEFYAPWSPPCIHLEPVFAELSLKYTTARLRFGKVDAARWPQLAAAHRVQVYGALPHLPTFVEFKGGKEVGRIPHLFEDGTISSIKVRRQDIITAFGLEEVLQDAAKPAAGPAGGGRAAGSKAGGSAKKRR
ncbi:hypothetical protein ABPG75_006480 [Micractinium tetrahymenae]